MHEGGSMLWASCVPSAGQLRESEVSYGYIKRCLARLRRSPNSIQHRRYLLDQARLNLIFVSEPKQEIL
jgi:hypothetical protein